MILAQYDIDFQPLSRQHEDLIRKADDILDAYRLGRQPHPTYAVIGTFGAGKTQFLYSLARRAIRQGLLPLLFLAEDLFSEIIRTETVFTQGDVATLVESKIKRAIAALSVAGQTIDKARSALSAVVDPRSSANPFVEDLATKFSGATPEDPRVVLLVDELEGQYRTLQQRVQTPGDLSPLRELFDARVLYRLPYLKFFALAPAGVYEMGGADQTRALRLVIPAADVMYIRGRLIASPGRANACWWLSRGKARHLFKACDTLRDAPRDLSASQVAHVVEEQLDRIGQPPTDVPAASIEGLSPLKLPALVEISPTPTSSRRCYHIELSSLDEGKMAERLSEAFKLTTGVSLLLAEYFKTTALALSDQHCSTFITDDELGELLSLSLDHLLEYEYGNPHLVQHMGDVLGLYERFRSDPGAVYGMVGHLWEHKDSNLLLPLSISEIRRIFRFPLMNPIVRRHNPSEMQRKWEGKGLPLWKWSEDRTTCWFFASSRDYTKFLETDDFASTVLPDGASALCLFPPDDVPQGDGGLTQWCRTNGKLNTEQLPRLVADFLLSGTGDLTAALPGDLQSHLKAWTADKTDILLSRKAQIYWDALKEIVRGALPQPKWFCKEAPPDADSVWGRSQVSDRALAVTFLAIAWADFNADQREALAQLRDLFRSGKDGKGAGDLNRLKPQGGVVGLADDLLPRYDRHRMLTDSPVVQRILGYWPERDRSELIALAHQVTEEKFLKLCPEENCQRVLESLWRSVRGQFTFKDQRMALDACARWVEFDILPALESGCNLETSAKDNLAVTGIEFEEAEGLVKAVGGFRQLLGVMKECLAASDGDARQTQRALLEFFVRSLDVSKPARVLQTRCGTARQTLERLDQAATALIHNYWEYPKAVAYLEITEEDIKHFVNQEKNMPRTCTLVSLEHEARLTAARFDEVNQTLKRLEDRLHQVAAYFGTNEGGEAGS